MVDCTSNSFKITISTIIFTTSPTLTTHKLLKSGLTIMFHHQSRSLQNLTKQWNIKEETTVIQDNQKPPNPSKHLIRWVEEPVTKQHNLSDLITL